MNDQVINTQSDEAVAPDELTLLRERAITMGMKISGNIGLETLKKRINDKLAGGSDEADDEDEADEDEQAAQGEAPAAPEATIATAPSAPLAPAAPPVVAPAAAATTPAPTPVAADPGRKLTKAEREMELRRSIQAEKLALVRCRIYNLNPAKRDLEGEIITIGNKYLGTIRKFIPFGEQTDGGYHIPKCIYDDLKSRKYQHIQTKTVKGQIEVKTRMAPEYNIEILEPLTDAERAELALSQQAAERVGV